MKYGKKQKLIVAKTVDFGVYLAEDKMQARKTEYFFQPNRFRKEPERAMHWMYLFTRIPGTVLLQPPENHFFRLDRLLF